MDNLARIPLIILLVSFFAMWLSARLGFYFRKRRSGPDEAKRQDLDLIVTSTLTLLGLIIGFSFSMAISRYDQRKTYEEAEANAIGTEYVRADLLPPADASRVRSLLKEYLDERILFYQARDAHSLPGINSRTAQLQGELWSAVQAPAAAQPTPVIALAVSGMNDVLNSQGYTQAAWWNQIPPGAWILMATVAFCSNFLLGYGVHYFAGRTLLFLVLPLVLSIAFAAIADIDSPRWGMIRVPPQNLISLAQSMPGSD
jgi:hypothetical protein